MLLGKYIELGRKPYLYKQTFYRIGLFLSYYTSNSDIWLLSKILIYQQRNLHMMNKSHYIMGQLMHFKCMELAKWNWWAIIEQLDSQVIYHWKPQRVKFISNLLLSNYKTAKFYHKKRTTFSTSYTNLISQQPLLIIKHLPLTLIKYPVQNKHCEYISIICIVFLNDLFKFKLIYKMFTIYHLYTNIVYFCNFC